MQAILSDTVMDAEAKASRAWQQTFFDIQKMEVRRCLEPAEQCEARAIRAHSIQNATILKRLADSGHVITFDIAYGKGQPLSVDFKRVGRNKAATFTGLCPQHDAMIFEPIEKNPVNLLDPEHLFLLAYRSALMETHKLMEAAVRMQAAYVGRGEEGSGRGSESW